MKEGEKMSEKKGVRQLERELKEARIREKQTHDDNITKNRDYSVAGTDPTTTVEKAIPVSSDIPSAILLPKKHKKGKENIPF